VLRTDLPPGVCGHAGLRGTTNCNFDVALSRCRTWRGIVDYRRKLNSSTIITSCIAPRRIWLVSLLQLTRRK
jgi:hypothetical protein